jgi:hypothetical protein
MPTGAIRDERTLVCRDAARSRGANGMNTLVRAFRGPLTTSPVEPVFRAVPALLYMCAIFFASSVPGDEISFSLDDRVAHFLEYFVLGALLVFFAVSLRNGGGRGAAIALLAFVAIHAVADEFHQSMVPNRDPSAKDWLFDMAGATTAVLALRSFARVKEAR